MESIRERLTIRRANRLGLYRHQHTYRGELTTFGFDLGGPISFLNTSDAAWPAGVERRGLVRLAHTRSTSSRRYRLGCPQQYYKR